MAVWKPKAEITVKVLGLVWRGADLLAGEVWDSAGRLIGVRPLGGGIEFSETREQAMVREFREELDCTATIVGPWYGIENIFTHEGHVGHQFMFVADIELDDVSLYERDEIPYRENDGTRCHAAWFRPTALPPGVELFLLDLLALIGHGVVGPPIA